MYILFSNFVLSSKKTYFGLLNSDKMQQDLLGGSIMAEDDVKAGTQSTAAAYILRRRVVAKAWMRSLNV